MNKLQVFEKAIEECKAKEAEANGVYKTYVEKLKELGVKNLSDAEKQICVYEEEVVSLQKEITLLENEIEKLLEEME